VGAGPVVAALVSLAAVRTHTVRLAVGDICVLRLIHEPCWWQSPELLNRGLKGSTEYLTSFSIY